ncbi:ABC transporter permease [Rhodococcus hoagii]|nr:ABC transporter permease [Prescottella equi]
MIWVTWRQFRTTILAAVGAILALAGVAAICRWIAASSESTEPPESALGPVTGSTADMWAAGGLTAITLAAAVLPVVLGLLVGVTVFSRDIERGTHVLGLSQSVSRARWYWTRVLVVFVPITMATAMLGAVLEWTRASGITANYAYISRVTWSGYSRLTFPLFQSSTLTLGAYAFLALVVGALAALLLRNTLGAMAVALVAVSALMVGFQVGARPHYATPAVDQRGLDDPGRPPFYWTGDGGGWILRSGYVDPNGRNVDFDYSKCGRTGQDFDWDQRPNETATEYEAREATMIATQDRELITCQRAQGLDHYETRYHPDSLFRRFQLIESALALALSALLIIPSMWAVRRLRP